MAFESEWKVNESELLKLSDCGKEPNARELSVLGMKMNSASDSQMTGGVSRNPSGVLKPNETVSEPNSKSD